MYQYNEKIPKMITSNDAAKVNIKTIIQIGHKLITNNSRFLFWKNKCII